MPERTGVFEVLEYHGHKLCRGVIGEVGGSSRQRHPRSYALQFLEQARVFRQPLRAWVVYQVLVLPVAETPALVVPIFDLYLEKPQSTSGNSASQVR